MRLLSGSVNEKNLNEFGRFDALKDTIDKAVAKSYFEKKFGMEISPNTRFPSLGFAYFPIQGGDNLQFKVTPVFGFGSTMSCPNTMS